MKTKMMIYVPLILSAIMLGGCTHNNGDIGDLFGEWRLEELKADGVPQPLYDSETLLYTWEFQSDIIFIQTILPHESYARAKGTWSRTDGMLMLDFDHHDIDGYIYYTPPAPLHLVERGVTPLHLVTLDGKNLRAEYTASDGIKYEYVLRKAY